MRQRRHTTAYAPSWQPSGNGTATHRHSSGKKPRPFSRGAPNLTLQSGKSWPPCAVETDGPRQGCQCHAAPSVCSIRTRHVLLLTAKQLLFQATPAIGRPAWAAKCRRSLASVNSAGAGLVLGSVGVDSQDIIFTPALDLESRSAGEKR